ILRHPFFAPLPYTTLFRSLETTKGEREAAEYVAAKLTEVGYEVEVLDSGAPGRTNVFCRLPGADRSRGALLVHGHLDVVPADARSEEHTSELQSRENLVCR